MGKYRKKPVEIEAVQFNGGSLGKFDSLPHDQVYRTGEAFSEFPEWLKEAVNNNKILTDYPYNFCIYIDTLEGKMRADKDDYIIRGISGEIYPCKPDIFKKSYEAVSD